MLHMTCYIHIDGIIDMMIDINLLIILKLGSRDKSRWNYSFFLTIVWGCVVNCLLFCYDVMLFCGGMVGRFLGGGLWEKGRRLGGGFWGVGLLTEYLELFTGYLTSIRNTIG